MEIGLMSCRDTCRCRSRILIQEPALFNTESEYIALLHALQELTWPHHFLKAIRYDARDQISSIVIKVLSPLFKIPSTMHARSILTSDITSSATGSTMETFHLNVAQRRM